MPIVTIAMGVGGGRGGWGLGVGSWVGVREFLQNQIDGDD